MANINRLAKKAKLIMAGPIGIEDDLRGIFLMNCADSTEVENFVRTDSAVITGRLDHEILSMVDSERENIFLNKDQLQNL